MIIFKEGVRIVVYSGCIEYILSRLSLYHRTYKSPEDIFVTSINDSNKHSKTSRHYKDEAIDVRSKNFTKEEKTNFLLRMPEILHMSSKTKFTVLLEGEGTENEHFHIQVKKGTTYNG